MEGVYLRQAIKSFQLWHPVLTQSKLMRWYLYFFLLTELNCITTIKETTVVCSVKCYLLLIRSNKSIEMFSDSSKYKNGWDAYRPAVLRGLHRRQVPARRAQRLPAGAEHQGLLRGVPAADAAALRPAEPPLAPAGHAPHRAVLRDYSFWLQLWQNLSSLWFFFLKELQVLFSLAPVMRPIRMNRDVFLNSKFHSDCLV